ncbi:hypothetical protein RF11_08387 [Thelohanellus kitauei]|uniref:Tc1-like transposase DDE domain-containing protein n=1 Tax=Thelohanellus kitauei TaxID=669202 RepID=A0A0C2N0Z0_THEKT|nr:hypothetical protein RF11_08387 [Thelohanellus kitauei]
MDRDSKTKRKNFKRHEAKKDYLYRKNSRRKLHQSSEIFSIKIRTVAKIHEKYMAPDEAEEDKRGGARGTKPLRKIPLTQGNKNSLQEFDLMVTEKIISRAISNLRITYKLTRLVTISRNTEETSQKRCNYEISFFEVPLHMSEDVICIDETGINLHLRRKFGRSPSRKRVAITVSSSKGVNISGCAAMYNGRLVHFRSKVGSYNSKDFIQFLTQMFEKTGTGKKHLVMEHFKNSVENRGRDIIFLPPYSLQLNQIELLISQWKSTIKAEMKIFSSRDLLQAIQRASLQITPENCQLWIRESRRFVSMALWKATF